MIQLTIAWTCVGIFIATALLTLLALVGVIKLAEKKYLDRLFKVLVLEVCTVCVGMFTGYVELPSTVEKRVEEAGEEKAWNTIEPKILALNKEIEVRESKVQEYLKMVPPAQVKPADRELMEKPLRLDPKVLRTLRGR